MMSKRKSTERSKVNKNHKRKCKETVQNDDLTALISTSSESWGIIESISLQNFMCHSRLTMKFPGSLNFIIGNNGSGKSALLTALVVGLGGKTTATSRGTSTKSLIKTGSSYAVVEIGMRNNNDSPFKPEIYGDKIIVERKINSDGQSSYKLKNSSSKVVSNKKEDLVQILDHMNLQVDNPLTCLNQEMSKNFLHSKTESDKYKFFLKSTQLDQMCKDYRYITEQKLIMEETIKRKERALPGLEKEVIEKEERFKNLATLQELKGKVETLEHEKVWSHVAQLEHALKPTKKELDRERIRTPMYEEASAESVRKETNAKKKFDELQKLVNACNEEVNELQPEKQQCKSRFERCKAELKRLEQDKNRVQRQKRDMLRDRSELEAKILELKNSTKNDAESQIEERKQELAGLYQQAKQIQGQISILSNQIHQFVQAVVRSKEQAQLLKQEEGEIRREQQKIRQSISNLTAGKLNKLQLFGPKMPDFVNKINDAFKRKQFNKKPRGPIGSCIALKDPALAVPVECAIQNSLTCFVVDNHADEKLLEKLRNSVFTEYERSRITIYTQRFSDTVYDVSRGKARHPSYSTVFDLLVIDDPVIANCLIDIKGIETLLVIPDTQAALKTMQGSSPPPNCSRAFTKDGDEVYSDRFYSNQNDPVSRYLQADVEAEIQRHSLMLRNVVEQADNLKSQISSIATETRQNEIELRTHERLKASANKKLQNVNLEIRELEMVDDPQPLDIKDLEDEVINYTQQIESMETVFQEKESSCKDYHQHLMEAKQACERVQSNMRDIAEKTEEFEVKINIASSDLEKAKADQAHFKEGKRKHLQELERLNRKVREQEHNISTELEKAMQICPDRIQTRRTPTNIDNEIKQINRRVQQEEEQHGDHELIVREYHEVQIQYKNIKKQLRWARNFYQNIIKYLQIREANYIEMRKMLSMRCNLDFNILLNQRGFYGMLTFKHDEQTLVISIQPHETSRQSRDLRGLSGGERSFSTVCFVLALWQAIESPLRCLDEFDVFMDMANRRVAMDMMVEMALLHTSKQFIFLTPHDISALPKSPRIHVWKMANPKRGHAEIPHSQM